MDFPQLNLPEFAIKTKLVKGTTQVFDPVRKKYFKLTPEEWVRQHVINYLSHDKKYPFGLMGIEKTIKYNTLRNRPDIILYNTEGIPNMIVECKAPSVNITQNTFNQIARYNFKLRVRYLLVTNGIKHFCCAMDYDKNRIDFLESVPSFY